jgi:hypothetical protein
VHLYSNFERKTCPKWCSPKRAAPERGRAATSRRPAPPWRPGPPAHVPKVARVVPRSRLASRRLEHRERRGKPSRRTTRHGPAVLALSPACTRPKAPPVHPLVARRVARRYKAQLPLRSARRPPPRGPTALPPAPLLAATTSCGPGRLRAQPTWPPPFPTPAVTHQPPKPPLRRVTSPDSELPWLAPAAAGVPARRCKHRPVQHPKSNP